VPDQVAVEAGLGKEPVRIAGVLDRETLPGRYLFALPDSIWEEVQRKSDVPQVREIRSGPLTEKWADLEALPAETIRYLNDQSVEWCGTQKNSENQEVWVFLWTGEDKPGAVGHPR
jgi:hypothetical protein